MMISIENDDFVYQQEDVRAGQWEKDGLPPGTSRRCTQDDDDDDDGDDDDGGDDNDDFFCGFLFSKICWCSSFAAFYASEGLDRCYKAASWIKRKPAVGKNFKENNESKETAQNFFPGQPSLELPRSLIKKRQRGGNDLAILHIDRVKNTFISILEV